MNALTGMGVVAGSFALVFCVLRMVKLRMDLHPEISRKLVHIGMGLVTVTFPWLFSEVWPVWILSGGFVVVMAALRVVAPLRQRFGTILGGEGRESWGEFYFPVAVAIVFTIAHREPVWYVIPIMVLTLADAMAALIGVRFGQLKYQTDDGRKSIEGSVAFFAMAAVSTLAVAMLMGGQPLMRVVTMAVCVGVLTALVEAMSWRGLDNLFLPLATVVMLVRFEERETGELVTRLFVALGLFGLLLFWRRRTTLRGDAVASATLTLYVCWAVGGWLWLLPPLLVALAYTFLLFRPERLPSDVHGHFVIISMAAPAFVWLFADKGLEQGDFRSPYVLSLTAQLAMVFLARWKRCRPSANTLVVIGSAAVMAWLIVFVPATLLASGSRSLAVGGAALGIIAGITGAFCFLEGHVVDMPNTPRRWLLQAALAFAGSITGLLPFFKP